MSYSPNGKHRSSWPPSHRYELTDDPVFYIMLGLFALLTTGLPALMGQPSFMPIAQAVALTLFTAAALRRGRIDLAVRVVAIWLGVQIVVIVLAAGILPRPVERAIPNGFTYRTALIEWAATGNGLPGWLGSAPLERLGEVLGVLLGSLLTAGLVGAWFLVRATNLLGYAAGSLSRVAPQGLLLGLAPWRILTVCGYAGFYVLLAQSLLNNQWRLSYYLSEQRPLLIGSTLLVLLGLALELVLPGVWQAVLGVR